MAFSPSSSGLLRQQAYIDGQWCDAASGQCFDVYNPATGTLIATVAKCGQAETRAAIEAAKSAQPAWAGYTAKQRAGALRAWYDEIIAHQDELAGLLTAEQGKPLAEARSEILYGANFVEWFAEEAKRIYGDTIAPPSNDKRVICLKQPVGVVACITPWNFPSAMLTRKIAPALAAGCSVVCKPANETPLSALALAELAARAGIPAGVINILCGHTEEIGRELTSNPIVRKLSFTGSTEIGRKLIADCAATVKRASMELGGNAPFIVFEDADIEAAVAGLIACKFRNAGQTCVCANRIFVQDGIYDVFVEALSKAVDRLQVGDGALAGTDIGPLINARAVGSVRALVEAARAEGAKVFSADLPAEAGDNFLAPTILTDVNLDMEICSAEIFGPVAPIYRFSSEAEIIALANDTEYGLASYIYTRDMGRMWRVSEALEYGIVGINEAIISNEMAPFGGVKQSGHGREGSKYGLDDYLEIKYLCIGGVDR